MPLLFSPPSITMPTLKRKLWIGTFLVDIVGLIIVGIYWPRFVSPLLWGILLGLFYLWSLLYNAEHPRRGIQPFFSLFRMVILGYILVKIAHGNLMELALVMSGLLSYKFILIEEYFEQAMRVFSVSSKR